jgi:hypothetical protein
MAPDTRFEIKETSRYTFEVFDNDPQNPRGRQWLGSFCFFTDALEFVKKKQSVPPVGGAR